MNSKKSVVDSNRMRKLRWQNAMDNNKLLKQLAEKRKQRIKPIVLPVYDNVDKDDEDVIDDVEDFDVSEDDANYNDDYVGSKNNEKIKALQVENQKLCEEHTALETKSKELSKAYETLKADLKQLERKRKKLEQENDRLHELILERQQLDKQYGEVTEWVTRCKELVEENESLMMELNNLDLVNATWIERYEKLEKENEELRGGEELDDTFDDAAFLKTVVFFFLMFLAYNLFSFAMLNWKTGEKHTQLPW